MAGRSLSALRAEASAIGLADVVEDVYSRLVEEAREAHDRPREIRRVAWHAMVGSTPACLPFWRHGFRSRWGRRYAEGDTSAIPRFDDLQKTIAAQFPEFAGRDGEHALAEFLMSDCPPLPSRAELYEKALAIVTDQADVAVSLPSNYEELAALEY